MKTMTIFRPEDLWQSTFNFFDRNNSGTISEQEIYDTLRTLGQECTRKQVRDMLMDVGCDPGDSLDFDHFNILMQCYFPSTATISPYELRSMYQAIDIDLSGYLTAAKIRHFLTLLGIPMHDSEMDEMVNLFDADGDNQISITEFETVLQSMGFCIAEEETSSLNINDAAVAPAKQHEQGSISLNELPAQVCNALMHFDPDSTGVVPIEDLIRGAQMLHAENSRGVSKTPEGEVLHWDPTREKRGLGDLVHKANHMAIIVSDVGRSARFYSDVLGLQQIRRPNFDKHGAWFTMGNMELHLIKGKPLVHSGDDLIVNHISLETYGIADVPARLRELGVPFRQNVSVPKGEDSGAGGRTNIDKDSAKIVRQFFFRDPDGYYIEICNCMLLTEYCLGRRSTLSRFGQQSAALGLETASATVHVMQQWARTARESVKLRGMKVKQAMLTDGSLADIGKVLNCNVETIADEDILVHFKIRRTVYGDICQNFTEEQLEEVVRVSGNDARKASELMYIKAAVDGKRQLLPPAFYEDGQILVTPPPILV